MVVVRLNLQETTLVFRVKGGQTLGNKRLYSLSGLQYIVEYPIIEKGVVTNKISFDINSKKPLNTSQLKTSVEKLKEETQVKNHLNAREKEAKEQWTLVEQLRQNLNQDNKITASSLYGVDLYDVPAYTDSDGDGVWDGCSPISGAMVLGYWDSHGYPNFPSEIPLIDELHVAMGTDSNGATYTSNIPTGITTQL